MENSFINPYQEIAALHTDGLDAIIAELIASPTENDLIEAIKPFINSRFEYPEFEILLPRLEFHSVCFTARNAYINNEIKIISSEQEEFIYLLIDGIKKITPVEIPNYITEIENKIGESNLGVKEKMPLLFATAIGKANCEYWLGKLATPGDWGTYFDFSSNLAANLINIPFWTTAAIQAVLSLNYVGDYTTDQMLPPKFIGPDFVTALMASLMVGAGKVIFRWGKTIKVPDNQYRVIEGPSGGMTNMSSEFKSFCICHVNNFMIMSCLRPNPHNLPVDPWCLCKDNNFVHIKERRS